jgi:CRISPR-associated protein Cas1
MTELLNTLYVQTQGAALFLDHDAVRVTSPDRPGHQALPLRRLNSIIAYGNVSISPDLLRRCAEDGRNVVWMSRSGRFVARVDGPVQGTSCSAMPSTSPTLTRPGGWPSPAAA